MSVILIIDDVPAMREQYAYDLKRLGGHEVLTAAGGAEGLGLLEGETVDCIILDLEMPGVDGFEVLATLKRRGNRLPVIVYTGTGTYDRCVRAVKLGAYSFLAKHEPLERVAQEVENALAWGSLRNEVARLRRQEGQDAPLIGQSRAAEAMKQQIDRLAAIPSAVLITGESGSGKELVARRLHDAGSRARGPFVAVNCAALPETMVESELFGHERGAFTGADRTRRGAFETASGGTLFLDEIGELPASAQAKLLRVLEENRVVRLGSHQPLAIDTRVVAATNRDLQAEAAAGRFRQDLLYRLNTHLVRVPPLRERLSDIPLLAEHFLRLTCEKFGTPAKSFSPGVTAMLQRYDWCRNNVRELRNVVERLVIAADAAEIGTDLVPAEISRGPAAGFGREGSGVGAPVAVRRSGASGEFGDIGDIGEIGEIGASGASGASAHTGHAAAPGALPAFAGPGSTLRDLKAAAERQIVLTALERNDWHITRTAAQLGLADHSSLLKIMRRHGLKR